MLQAPGPRGSPQDPHALIGRSQFPDDLAGVLDCAAKTDMSFWSSTPLHAGHAGDLDAQIGTLATGCIADALHAFGVRHVEMPATSERIWRAMGGMPPRPQTLELK